MASLEDTLADDSLHEVHTGATKSGSTVRVLQFNIGKAGAALKQLHARIHPLMRFYIDGASELQQDDERMEVMLAVQMTEGQPTAVLGVLTFFKCAPCSSVYLFAVVLAVQGSSAGVAPCIQCA